MSDTPESTSRLDFSAPAPVDMSQDKGEGQASAPTPIPEKAETAREELVEDNNPVKSETEVTDNTNNGAVEAALKEDPVIKTETAASGTVDVAAAIAQRDALDAQIESAKKEQRVSIIEQIKNIVQTYEIPLPELAEALGFKSTRKGSKAKPKYRDPATGKEWSGRGKAPLWIKDQDKNKFLITA